MESCEWNKTKNLRRVKAHGADRIYRRTEMNVVLANIWIRQLLVFRVQ